MKKILFLLLIVFALVFVGCKSAKVENNDNKIVNTEIKTEIVGKTSEEAGNGFVLLSDLKKHDNPTDCWVVFHGGVYDITEYLGMNEDSSKLGDYCGTEKFEDAFNNMFGDDNSGLLETEGVYKGLLQN